MASQKINNLFQKLQDNKDLNSPRKLSAEAERELTLVEEKLQYAHVDHLNPELDCILVRLPSINSSKGILKQRKDSILEWIFLTLK